MAEREMIKVPQNWRLVTTKTIQIQMKRTSELIFLKIRKFQIILNEFILILGLHRRHHRKITVLVIHQTFISKSVRIIHYHYLFNVTNSI